MVPAAVSDPVALLFPPSSTLCEVDFGGLPDGELQLLQVM